MPSQSNDELLQHELEKGAAFEEMIRTKGWEFILAFYKNKIQSFTTNILTQESEDITKFEAERRELIALKKLIGNVSSSIETLKHERDKD